MVSQATLIETGRACNVDLPAEEYHASQANGSSDLEMFRESRREYHRVKVLGGKSREATAAMDFGTVVHLQLLEPERVAHVVAEPYPALAPDGKKWNRRKGSDHERWWKEEEEARAGKLAFTQADWDRLEAVVASVKSNEQAMSFLDRQGKSEYSIFWTDRETELELKCRVDWMSSIALDLKTTCDASPRAYANQLARLGYHRKKAHYEAGLQALFGSKAPRFAHIAIETDSPYRVACYELDDRDGQSGESIGRLERRATLREIALCYKTGDWREPWEKKPKVLGLPGWAFREADYNYLENPQ